MKVAPIALTVSLLTLLNACGNDGKGQSGVGSPGATMPPAEVEVITAAVGKSILTQDLPGRLQAARSAQVRARVEGVIEKRLFTEGSDIKAGTPLFTIDPRTYKAALESAKADMALAKLTTDRYRGLLELKAVSQQEFDQASARLKQTEAVLSKAELDYENATVPAPISGRIGRALVTEGALVGKSEATQLALIEQLDPIFANLTQSTSDLLLLKRAIQSGKLQRVKETKVELALEDGSLYPLPGKMLFSDLAVDPNTGAVILRAEFPNPKRELLPGMFVRVRFPQASLDEAIKVPQRAVQSNAQGQSVLLVDPQGKVVVRAVKTGGMSGTDWIIAEGLEGGERVIVNGLQKARPGTLVTPVPTTTALAAPVADKAAVPTNKQGN